MNRRIEQVFEACFHADYCTRLVGGAAEPFYSPAQPEAVIYYREDFAASALHEVAHWCIAGERRRNLPDFGYWYAPDGRNAAEQSAFEAVEVKPQALEWHFALACGLPFRVSMDNLDGDAASVMPFAMQVANQAAAYASQQQLPERARIFRDALALEFGGSVQLTPAVFSAEIAA